MTMKSYRNLGIAIVAVIALIFSIILLLRHGTGKTREIMIATGKEGLTFHRLGEQLSWSLSEPRNSIKALPDSKTTGSIDNLNLIINESKPSKPYIGFVSKAVLDGQEATNRVKVLATLYRDLVQIVAKTNITKLDESVRRTIFLGDKDSGTQFIAERILSAISTNAWYDPVSENEDPDVAFYVAGTPANRVQNALDNHHHLIGTDYIKSLGDKVPSLDKEEIHPFT